MSSTNDLEDLLNAVLPTAIEHLKGQGGFYPFGAGRTESGETRFVAGYEGAEPPAATELMAQLTKRLSEGVKAREYAAVSIVADVNTPSAKGGERSDAIHVFLEHSDGTAADVFLPYDQNAETGAVHFFDMIPHRAPARIVRRGKSDE